MPLFWRSTLEEIAYSKNPKSLKRKADAYMPHVGNSSVDHAFIFKMGEKYSGEMVNIFRSNGINYVFVGNFKSALQRVRDCDDLPDPNA